MSHPWDDTVRLGVIEFMAFPELAKGEGRAAEIAASLLADGFFTAMEVCPLQNAEERKRLKKVLEDKGAALTLACQPLILSRKLDPNSLNRLERARAVDCLRKASDEARQLQAAGIGVMSGPDPASKDRAASLEALHESMVSVCRAARDIPVHLEVFDHDVDKKCLVGPTIRGVELARKVRATEANFGLMLDLSHFPLQHESTAEALEAGREVITHAHAGNCVLRDRSHPQFGDSHPRFGIPGGENGVEELADYLRRLFGIGYLKRGAPRMLSLEVKPGPGETSMSLIEHTRKTWEAAWEQAASRG